MNSAEQKNNKNRKDLLIMIAVVVSLTIVGIAITTGKLPAFNSLLNSYGSDPSSYGELTINVIDNDGEAYKKPAGSYLGIICYGKGDTDGDFKAEVDSSGKAYFSSLRTGSYRCWFDEDSEVDADVNESINASISYDSFYCYEVGQTNQQNKVPCKMEVGLDSSGTSDDDDDDGWKDEEDTTPRGSITVTVVDDEGDPYETKENTEKIVVICEGTTGEGPRIHKRALEFGSGNIILENVQYGTYECRFQEDQNDGYNYIISNTNKYPVVVNDRNRDAKLTMPLIAESNNDQNDETGKESSEIIVRNVDENGKLLAGTKLCIADKEDNECLHGTTWTSGATEPVESRENGFYNIPVGSYYVKVISVASGYQVSKDYSFIVDGKGGTKTINVVNVKKNNDSGDNNNDNNSDVEEMTLTVKYLNENNKDLKGATLRLLDAKGVEKERWVTGTSSKVFPNLPLGFYTIEEVKAAEGYSSTQKVRFELATSGGMYTVTLKAAPAVKVPDTLSNTSKILIVISLAGLVVGAWLIYSNVKRREEI